MIRSEFPIRYPDGSTEQFSYQRPNGQKILDLTHFKDRENRWTLFGYDALRQRTASIDPIIGVSPFGLISSSWQIKKSIRKD